MGDEKLFYYLLTVVISKNSGPGNLCYPHSNATDSPT